MAPALLLLVVAPELLEDLQRPPIQQRAEGGKLCGRSYATTRVEEYVLGGIVWQFRPAGCFVVISGVSVF
jgi:hypothetical protein